MPGTTGRVIPRAIAPTIVAAMAEARAVALLGARQAGKSTIARLLANGPLEADYVSLDEEPLRQAAVADPAGFVAQITRRTVIDEVQRSPELLLALKSRLDRDGSPGQFLLTGSANLRRVPTIADALPGRVDYLTLWPLTQGEIAGKPEHVLERLFEGDVPQVDDAPVGRSEYADLLLAGGFPEARARSSVSRRRFFNSYVDSIVEREVPDAARIHDPASVDTLLRLVAARSGSLARYEALSRHAGIDGKTVKSHLDVLERLFLIRIRRAWHVNLGKRQVKAPKLYVSDPGMLSALLNADGRRILSDDGFAGSLFETFVATELERQASWSTLALRFWHYRDGEREVDVVVEHPSGDIVGIEVKASGTVRERDLRGLAHLRDAHGTRFRAGIVAYTGQRTLPFGDRLWALPLNGLWS